MSIATAIKKVSIAIAGSVFFTLVTAASSMSATISYNGNTIGQATWNRPQPNLNFINSTATNVPYSVQQFNVAINGAYDFFSRAVFPGSGWDNVLFLYQNNFNPNTPLVNGIIGNNDFPNAGLSGFNSVSLAAGTQYFLVTTGFSNSSAGIFSNTINGSGNITLVNNTQPVPEPLTIFGAFVGGSFIVGLRHKYKQQRKTN
jgi:hypothetical protein